MICTPAALRPGLVHHVHEALHAVALHLVFELAILLERRADHTAVRDLQDVLDGLRATAGVGEHAPLIREKCLEGLEFLGIKLDKERNKVRGEACRISADDSKVEVWVVPTNEELLIARDTLALITK